MVVFASGQLNVAFSAASWQVHDWPDGGGPGDSGDLVPQPAHGPEIPRAASQSSTRLT
jgi:hypothetical protein